MSEKILVVDDEKEITDLISLYLRNENYTVHSFYDSLRAYEATKEEDFDLAILDVMMPKMDGFMLCQKIREQHNYPIIMLTAKEEEIDKITGLTLGADDYITKPFRPLERKASGPDSHGIYHPLCALPEKRTGHQCGRVVSRRLGRRIFQ